MTFALLFFVADVGFTVISALSWDEKLGQAGLTRIGRLIGIWVTPGIYLLLVVGGVVLMTRRLGSVNAWQGIGVGLISTVGVHLFGLLFAPPEAREFIVYPLLGVLGGWLGSEMGRRMLSGQEALYRASRDVGRATSPDEVAAAIGKHMAGSEVREISLWTVARRDQALGLDLVGRWSARSGDAPAERLDASRIPVLAELRQQSPRVVRRWEIAPSEREARERQDVNSALMIPLRISGEGPDGLLVVWSRGGWFSPVTIRAYLTVGAQAALALENLRLLEGARRSGELEERQRLAHEIHDTIIQDFASIVMNLEATEDSLGEDAPSPARRHLEEARRTAREGISETRRIVWALRPTALEEAPLPEALRGLAGRWSEASGVPARVVVTGTPRRLSPEVEATLLRTTQEALTNVRKHARAGRVQLTLSYMDDRITLDARDDGVGFDAESVPDGLLGGGYGLRAMRERVGRSGGTLLVESRPGGGTTLMAELPVGETGAIPVEGSA